MLSWIHILYLLLILYSLYVNAGTYLCGTVWAQVLTVLEAGCSALTDRLFSTITALEASCSALTDRLFSTIASDASFLHRLFSTITSDASRQKIIFLREAHGQCFGVAHLGFEQFLEARHKIFRWSSFADFSNLRCKPNRPKSCQRSGSRQYHVYD